MKTFTFVPKTHNEIINEGCHLSINGITYVSTMLRYAGKRTEFVERQNYNEWFRDTREGYAWHRNWLKRVDNIEKNGQYLLEGFE